MHIADISKTAYGIAGLKTGSTQAAGGCILIAAWQEVSGRMTLIVAATFGQPGTSGTILPNALQAGHSLVLALDRALALACSPVRVMTPKALLEGHPERHDRKAPPTARSARSGHLLAEVPAHPGRGPGV